jgi:hypothetical protein
MGKLNKSSKKNMIKSGRLPSARCPASIGGQEDPSPVPPQRAASVRMSGAVGAAVATRPTTGGNSVLPPSGAARVRTQIY